MHTQSAVTVVKLFRILKRHDRTYIHLFIATHIFRVSILQIIGALANSPNLHDKNCVHLCIEKYYQSNYFSNRNEILLSQFHLMSRTEDIGSKKEAPLQHWNGLVMFVCKLLYLNPRPVIKNFIPYENNTLDEVIYEKHC